MIALQNSCVGWFLVVQWFFWLESIDAEATCCNGLEAELNATEVSPTAQIEKYFSHLKFASLGLSLVQAEYFHKCIGFCLVCKESWQNRDKKTVVYSDVLVSADSSHSGQICSWSWSCLIFGRNVNPLCWNEDYQFPLSSKRKNLICMCHRLSFTHY